MKKVLILTALALVSTATVVIAAPEGHPKRHAMFERLRAADSDGNGLISRQEAASLPRIAERFAEIDANNDGSVSFEELHAFHAKHRGQHRAASMKHLDTDGNGQVSRAEWTARAAARFDRLDANKDGNLTLEELKAARAARHAHAGK